MKHVDPNSKFTDEAVCISQSANAQWKGMHVTILPPTMRKIIGQIRFFSRDTTKSLREGNSEFKLGKLRLKKLTLCRTVWRIWLSNKQRNQAIN